MIPSKHLRVVTTTVGEYNIKNILYYEYNNELVEHLLCASYYIKDEAHIIFCYFRKLRLIEAK